MALARLSGELLDIIIASVLPEGFESLALTCRRIYARCTPFIKRHNILRSQFLKVDYYFEKEPLSFPIKSAFDLIIRIAGDPIVARYIRDADFKVDGFLTRARPRDLSEEVHGGGALARSLAESPYLKQAGLDWNEYYAEIEEDLKAARYSQHAAAFLLTLLPNVETLALPRQWNSLEATDKLVEAVVLEAKRTNVRCDRPSLSHVTRFEPSLALGKRERFDLNWAKPFLALPHVRYFFGPSCVAIDNGDTGAPSKALYPFLGETLEIINLAFCCIDEQGITDLLSHTHRLKTLKYSHSTKEEGCLGQWDICKFVTAIERKVGTHLEELSVWARDLRGSITPGKATMRGFRRLRKLEFDLEIAMCNIFVTDRTTRPNEVLVEGSTNDEAGFHELSIASLIPASVLQLSLCSRGKDHHEKALDFMFHGFAAKKESQLPSLEEIHLHCPSSADAAYKERCARLLKETEKTDVVLHLNAWPNMPSLTWND